jgi:hypothetical protein
MLFHGLLQVAQRWRFATNPLALRKQGEPQVLPSARVADLAAQLTAKSYQVFLQDGQLYAFKGLAGRLGPIGVHIALLMCLAGKQMTCRCLAALFQAALQLTPCSLYCASKVGRLTFLRLLRTPHSSASVLHTCTCKHCSIWSNMSVKAAGTAWSGFGTWKGTAMCPCVARDRDVVMQKALQLT